MFLVFVLGRPFEPGLMFVDNTGAYLRGAQFRCTKHSSSLRTFVNYGRKKFYNIWSRTAASLRVQIFGTLLQESGGAVGHFVEQVVGIFVDVLSSETADSELQLKMFIILSKLLFETTERIDSQRQFGPFAVRERCYKTFCP
jgi:hypothetical protein